MKTPVMKKFKILINIYAQCFTINNIEIMNKTIPIKRLIITAFLSQFIYNSSSC